MGMKMKMRKQKSRINLRQKAFCFLLIMTIAIGPGIAAFASDGTDASSSNTTASTSFTAESTVEGTSNTNQTTANVKQTAGSAPSSEVKPPAGTKAAIQSEDPKEGKKAEAKDSTLSDFEKAMVFLMFINDEQNGLQDSGKSGSTQTIYLRWSYSEANIPINMDNARMEVTFPKGVTPAYPEITGINFEKKAGADGSTIVVITWENGDPGKSWGKETFIRFNVPNGYTPDSSEVDVSVKVYYNDQVSDKFSNDLTYTAITDFFKWNNVNHNPASRTINQPADNRAIQDFTIEYQLSPQNADKGLAYTKEVSFSEEYKVNPNILFKEADLVGNGLTFTDVVTDSSGYVQSFKVNFEANSTNEKEQITFQNPFFTVKNAVVSNSVTATTTITNALQSVSGSFSGTAKPVVAVKDLTDNKLNLTAGNQTTVTVYFPVTNAENEGLSKKLTLQHATSTNSNSSQVYKFDQVSFYLYNFGNSQKEAMDSFSISQIFDTSVAYPAKINTGKYSSFAPLTTYTINLYDSAGNKIGEIPDVSFNENKTLLLDGYVTASGKSTKDIARIEWDFGPVPSGFNVQANASYIPITYMNVLDQGDGPYKDVVTKAVVKYTYKGTTQEYNPNNLTYKYMPPNMDEDLVSRNKTMNNLTSPGSVKPTAGDLVEYTITITNRTGRDLWHPEVEDQSEGLSYYASPILDGYTGMNVKLATGTTASVSVASASIVNGKLFIKLNGSLKNDQVIRITYVMKVDESADKNDVLLNAFEAFGWPSEEGSNGGGGTPPQRIPVDSGFHKTKSTGDKALPRVAIDSFVYNMDDSSHVSGTPAVKGDEVKVVQVVKNVNYATNGKDNDDMHLGSLIGRISGITADGAGFVYSRGATLTLADGSSVTLGAPDSNTTVGAATSYTTMRFDLTAVNASGVVIPADKEITLTYYIKANRHAGTGLTGGTNYENLEMVSYAFFTETTKDYLIKARSSGYSTPYGDGTGNGDIDRIDKTKSYSYTTDRVYLKREPVKYAAISNTVSPVTIDLGTVASPIRTYNVYFRNYSDPGDIIEINQMLAQLPMYESFKEGSAQITYREDSVSTAATSIADTNVVVTKTLDNRNILQFKNLSGNSKQGDKVAIDGRLNGDNYIQIKFETELVGNNLEAAMDKGQNWTDQFRAVFDIKDQDGVKYATGLSAGTYTLEKYPDTNDWDNNDQTTEFRSGPPLTIQNTFNNPVRPGTSIKTKEILISGTDEVYRDIDSDFSFTPKQYIGFEMTAGNETGNGYMRDLVNPKIVVILPIGVEFVEFKDGLMPTEITGYTIEVVDSRQVITFDTDVTLNEGKAPLKFSIKTSSDKAGLGIQQAGIYLVPMGAKEKFYTTSTKYGGSKKPALNLQNLTGITAEGFDKNFDMVYNSCNVPIYGLFAFSSIISVEESTAGKAVSGGSITVGRDVDTFEYTLEVVNESKDKTYENAVLINRLPGKGDIFNLCADDRDSNFNVVMDSEPVVKIISRTGAEDILSATEYDIKYAKDSRTRVFSNTADYRPTGGTIPWDSSLNFDEAVILGVFVKKDLPYGAKINVTYDAKFEGDKKDIPRFGVKVNNSFGFGFTSKGSTLLNIAEPAAVCVKMEDLYEGSIDGLIYIDKDNNGSYNPSIDDLYKEPIEVLLESKDGQITDTTQTEVLTGEFEFDKLELTEYTVSFRIPGGYKLATYTKDFGSEKGNAVSKVLALSPAQDRAHVEAGLITSNGGQETTRHDPSTTKPTTKPTGGQEGGKGTQTGDEWNMTLPLIIAITVAAILLVALGLPALRRKQK